jgi:hypothetical protein
MSDDTALAGLHMLDFSTLLPGTLARGEPESLRWAFVLLTDNYKGRVRARSHRGEPR